jgi:uncharacterized protein (TIGR04222 family)
MSRELSVQQQNLIRQLQAFAIDEGTPALSFSRRLARENGWTVAYTDRVVVEYLRFVSLAMVSGHTVTPSDQVDQAWHLHLTYTQSYWTRMCGELLGRPLHHGPTRGGLDESRKYRQQYEQTLRSYEVIFGTRPPADIWRPVEIRFGSDLQTYRVNPSEFWVIPKIRLRLPWGPRWSRPLRLFSVLPMGLLIYPETLGTVTERGAGADGDWSFGLSRWLMAIPQTAAESALFAILQWAFMTAILLAESLFLLAEEYLDHRHDCSQKGFDLKAEVSSISWTEAALLMGGTQRLAEAALAELAASGLCQIPADTETIVAVPKTTRNSEGEQSLGWLSSGPLQDCVRSERVADSTENQQFTNHDGIVARANPNLLNPVTAAVLNCLPLEKKAGLVQVRKKTEFAAAVKELTANLENRRLLAVDQHRWGQYFGLPTEWMLLFAGGACCVVLGGFLSSGGPMAGWKLQALLVALITLLIWPGLRIVLQQAGQPLTTRGRAVKQRLKAVKGGYFGRRLIDESTAMAVAVNGQSLLSKSIQPELQHLHEWMKPVPKHIGGCGGGGCGGGGCGCGGCGGGGCGGGGCG